MSPRGGTRFEEPPSYLVGAFVTTRLLLSAWGCCAKGEKWPGVGEGIWPIPDQELAEGAPPGYGAVVPR